jgi:hypothetical protein
MLRPMPIEPVPPETARVGVHTTFVQKLSLAYYTHNFSSTPFA